ncbi:TrmH family RNA methyltransferase [Kineococcus radiotolerans]|uniref:tRNA/rRNA methyltransferase (SpoU) n=1 Tax=Kineococcus radiotolerans (strain ATCC BAA-149 / DSM 14245 / SRS30216) TaxID=266940 RepID=A6W8G1_KINRD|nr:RNA methyltransferase [Kineococcus radiotolerans]ABS03100.1 tRNA/rRNA methyltransferase (SpoU) [Kineococcus radiotolerans SRS30216 = ATCC BAA-149]
MPLIELDDLTDPQHAGSLRDYTALKDVQLRARREPAEGLYLAEGVEVIRRALAAGHVPRSLLLSRSRFEDLADVLPAGATVFVAPVAAFADLTGVDLHRGALASMQRPAQRSVPDLLASLPAGPARLVVLEDVVDHTNVGALFRSAAAFGVDGVVVSPRCADPLYRRSVRVSMGTVLHLPWARAASWPGDLDLLRSAGFAVAALALTEDSVALGSFAVPERLALLLGTEGDGLSRRALSGADLVVRIPMDPRVDSLNVAAASAVALWETRRA